MDLTALQAFLDRGGPAMWVIAGLSVLTVALILWKLADLVRLGAWARGGAEPAVAAWARGAGPEALAAAEAARGVRPGLAAGAIAALTDPGMSGADAREETQRLARRDLARLRRGLRALELVATVAPLVGLLGTVLGMIEAFQALEAAGARSDPSVLAGGIWEALLTTAAGMAVAIPAAAALTWFESVADAVQTDLEDIATRLFVAAPGRGRAAA